MADFDELSWKEAMRRGHAALLDSEDLYDDINASEGRSNLDIEKHLRRSEVKAMQAQVWLALARELGSQGDRYGHPGTQAVSPSTSYCCFKQPLALSTFGRLPQAGGHSGMGRDGGGQPDQVTRARERAVRANGVSRRGQEAGLPLPPTMCALRSSGPQASPRHAG